jgi:transcriptional regulator with GAF, ATPase, and Fis domain
MAHRAGTLEHAGTAAVDGSRDRPILARLAETLASACDGALARVWAIGPGDLCAACPMRPECPDRARCLHLIASAGATRRTDGPFRRFPIGARQVGRAARDRRTFVAREALAASGLAESTWLATHAVRCFVAVPIVHDDALLGVAAVFSRRDLTTSEIDLVELSCHMTGAALAAGSRAPDLRPFADIERDVLRRVLDHTGGRVSGPRGAAAVLGLKPTTLASRMKKLGVSRTAR